MFRNIIAVVIGFIVGFMTNGMFSFMLQHFHPLPPGVKPDDIEILNQHFQTTPIYLFLLISFGILLSVFLAVYIAAKIAHSHKFILSLFPAVILFISTTFYLLMMPFPKWMLLVNIIGVLATAYLAAKRGAGGLPDYDL